MKCTPEEAEAIDSARDHERRKLRKVSELLSRCSVDAPIRSVLQREVDLICARLLQLRSLLDGPAAGPPQEDRAPLPQGPDDGRGLDPQVTAILYERLRADSAAFYGGLAASAPDAETAGVFRKAADEDLQGKQVGRTPEEGGPAG